MLNIGELLLAKIENECMSNVSPLQGVSFGEYFQICFGPTVRTSRRAEMKDWEHVIDASRDYELAPPPIHPSHNPKAPMQS